MFLFEEATNNLLNRSKGLDMDLGNAMDAGQLTIQQIDPAELAPGEFTHAVCNAADAGAKVIVIGSLNGCLHAMPDERFLTTHLHELLTYLGQKSVVTIIIDLQQSTLGGQMTTTIDAVYIADNVLMPRYYEMDGEVRQAVSVFKKRGSLHERTIPSFELDDNGIHVGEILKGFHGILTGVPSISPSTTIVVPPP